ncbi:isocitrate lyase/PEP mutase family protein [Collimonas pratensis]|uniref:Phosphoenolpyruvate phosphomutase family protein n=1 Tax=Collimonas pratensis TaxID=279113 RepID=A0ABN4M7F5_9BURK|nr:isocitrate lyase/phosphoenolpyruvate mutase family protein [Collimonas pratensis]AMP14178.1 phosphoenolpyruvate phosphomutase family protein [Collimonas pratensis]
MMMNHKEKAEYFHQLHVPRLPLVLFNIWDAGSAKAVAAAGAKAIATGSYSVASAYGYDDGENVPFDTVIANLERIVQATDLPVTVDLERGYGETAGELAASIERTIRAGAVGCNIEDSLPGNGKLRSVEEQVQRIRQARIAADGQKLPYFINVRSDVFFQGLPAEQNEAILASAIARAQAYAEAGADGIFVPGLADEKLIARLAAASPLPLNLMVNERTPSLKSLAEAGAARLSYGPDPYLRMMKALGAAARDAISIQH